MQHANAKFDKIRFVENGSYWIEKLHDVVRLA